MEQAIARRSAASQPPHDSAYRLFNGFSEGVPELVIDVYGRTLVLHDYSEYGQPALCAAALQHSVERLPFINSALRKQRATLDTGARLLGTDKQLCRQIVEDGVRYAIRLTLNRDASFYLDTRGLRAWAKRTLGGKRVLNTFAYTGSLGVAARAGGAHVTHTDRDARFLGVAKDSYALNGFALERQQFRTGDFFAVVAELKRQRALFDCVFLDAPFFSVSDKGRIDLENAMPALINKVRPLIADGGQLVAVNNAVFVSGQRFMEELQALCADGYMRLDTTIAVPEDSVGLGTAHAGADPAPFNHSTKIAVLAVRRKDGRKE